MKNVVDLRNDLLDVHEKTKSGIIDKAVAAELAKVADKIIKTAIIELEYNRFTKQGDKRIPFLES